MTSLDDKLLGEKLHYYCSSDEEDNEDNEDSPESHKSEDNINCNVIRDETVDKQLNKWDGYSVNTGPKGVIKDWQRYKQFENEKRDIDQKEKNSLIKKLSISCRSHLDEESDKNDKQSSESDSEDTEDQFLKEYMIKRMQEMMEQIDSRTKDRPDFGKLIDLNSGSDLLEAIDSELKFVTIICHIYSNHIQESNHMNECLSFLAQKYPKVKFCAIDASSAGMSQHFSKNGVPALLVYKSGNLLSNFVRLTDQLTKPFFAVDIEKFLIDHGILQNCFNHKEIGRKIREGVNHNQDLSD